MATHKCDKEKDLQQLAISNSVFKVKLENIENKVGSIENKLDIFIQSADDKYASKEEVNSIRKWVYWFFAALVMTLVSAVGYLINELLRR